MYPLGYGQDCSNILAGLGYLSYPHRTTSMNHFVVWSGAFLASNSESIAVDRAHVLFSILRQDMMNSQVIGNGSQAVTLAHGEHAELNQSTADEIQDVMDDIEQHSISREQEAREQQRLDEAIAHNDFNLAT